VFVIEQQPAVVAAEFDRAECCSLPRAEPKNLLLVVNGPNHDGTLMASNDDPTPIVAEPRGSGVFLACGRLLDGTFGNRCSGLGIPQTDAGPRAGLNLASLKSELKSDRGRPTPRPRARSSPSVGPDRVAI